MKELPADFPVIVCLCGSIRFLDTFIKVGWELAQERKIVLGVEVSKHVWDHGGETLSPDVKAKLDELHLRKIDLADEIWVLNVGGYVGDGLQKEIKYAESLGKKVIWLHPDKIDSEFGRGSSGLRPLRFQQGGKK